MKFADGNPFALCFSVAVLAVKNVERELEVGESLHEGSDYPPVFHNHSHVFFDVIS